MAHTTTILSTLRALRIEAGVKRDGTAEASLRPVLTILDSMAGESADLSTSRYLKIDAEREAARTLMPFCRVHDAHARGETSGDEYNAELARLRGK